MHPSFVFLGRLGSAPLSFIMACADGNSQRGRGVWTSEKAESAIGRGEAGHEGTRVDGPKWHLQTLQMGRRCVIAGCIFPSRALPFISGMACEHFAVQGSTCTGFQKYEVSTLSPGLPCQSCTTHASRFPSPHLGGPWC